MFNGLWPAFDEAEVPITSITNGVHAPTWVGREVFELAAGHGADLDGDDPDAFWGVVDKVPGEEVWATKRVLRERLVQDARKRLAKSWSQARPRARRAVVDRLRARPRRADHRLRAAGAVLQAAHADALATPSGSSGCCSTRSGRSSWSSPARRTRPTRAASG